MTKHYVECGCTSPGHVVRFTYDEEDNWVYIDYYLSSAHTNWWQRLKKSLSYLFKRSTTGEGMWGDTILDPQEGRKLKEFLEQSFRE